MISTNICSGLSELQEIMQLSVNFSRPALAGTPANELTRFAAPSAKTVVEGEVYMPKHITDLFRKMFVKFGRRVNEVHCNIRRLSFIWKMKSGLLEKGNIS